MNEEIRGIQPAFQRHSRNPDERLLSEMVNRIIREAAPTRIVLFGSAARDEMGPDSDLDVLVIVPDGVHRRQTAQKIYRALLGLGFATDVAVVTENDVRRFSNEHSLVICHALREGKDLYHAARA